MQMGGIVGRFQLDETELEPFWPYLWIGQWLHAGKSATMGPGRYAIEAASLPTKPTGPTDSPTAQ
ncbi:MAG: CRISPR system precrRNA processing endoribonuclease RAMP protein Cas6 [Methylococcales bacterium]